MTAILADFAEVTRWNTSCCGSEPSIMVSSAPRKVSHIHGSGGGKNSNLPACEACSMTTPAPPVMPLTVQAMNSSPPMLTVICTKSRMATENMPPKVV